MIEKKEEIIEYYSNLINIIDIECEKAILFFKTEDAVNEIETNRQNIISKIKQTEMIKLENFKDSETLYDGLFAFFIPNDQSYDKELFSDYHDSEYASNEKLDLSKNVPFSWTMSQNRGEKFKFVKHLGQLVVTSSMRFKNIRRIYGEFNIKYESCFSEKESTKFQVYAQLIQNKNDHVIIDLSQKERNQIDRLELIDMTESGFEMIPTYLDVESVRELEIIGYSDTEFPTQLFRPFKNLTRLKIDLYHLLFIKENSFIGLESLEILELVNMRIHIEENAFKALINLKLLIFTDCHFENFHKTSGLENLKTLKIKDCFYLDSRYKNLELFKNFENIQIFEIRFTTTRNKTFSGFEKLKILETDLKEEILLKSNLEILSLNLQLFKPHISFNGLKFLNIRVGCPLSQIEDLNQLTQLEFLDFELSNKLAKKFNQVNLPKLKYLVLTCENTPNFNQSLQNLQGLELIKPKYWPRDRFENLKSLDYLAITYPGESMIDTFCGTNFSTIKNLKYLKIEGYYAFELFYEDDKKNEINEKFSKLFESPENVMFNDESLFEKYLKVSDCIREFVLNNESNYYKEYLRNTKRRKSNFGLNEEKDSEIENESDYDNEDYFGEYDIDDDDYRDILMLLMDMIMMIRT